MNTNDTAYAKDKMNRLKQEVASEIGVNLKQGYNCLLYTSRCV